MIIRMIKGDVMRFHPKTTRMIGNAGVDIQTWRKI